MKKIAVALLIAAMLLGFSGCKADKPQKREPFTKPADYSAALDVTIKSTVRLYLNRDNTVLAIEYVDAEAGEKYKSAEQSVIDKNVKAAINELFQKFYEVYDWTELKKLTVNLSEANDGVDENSLLVDAEKASKEVIAHYNFDVKVITLLKGKSFEIEKSLLNPENELKDISVYRCYMPIYDAPVGLESIETVTLTLNKATKKYYYSLESYYLDGIKTDKTMQYDGKTWYTNDGIITGEMDFEINDSNIILSELGLGIKLVMNSEKALEVESSDAKSDIFRVGLIFNEADL